MCPKQRVDIFSFKTFSWLSSFCACWLLLIRSAVFIVISSRPLLASMSAVLSNLQHRVETKHLCTHQGGTTCGAIEGSSRFLKAIDKRVFTNFRDKYAVFTNFRDKNAVFTSFCDKIMFLNYMTKTQCLALILSV